MQAATFIRIQLQYCGWIMIIGVNTLILYTARGYVVTSSIAPRRNGLAGRHVYTEGVLIMRRGDRMSAATLHACELTPYYNNRNVRCLIA